MDLKDRIYQTQREAFEAPLTHRDTSTIVDIMISEMKAGVVKEGKVYLAGFGCLEKTTRKGRTWKIRGKEVTKGERDTVTFRPFTDIKKQLSTPRDV